MHKSYLFSARVQARQEGGFTYERKFKVVAEQIGEAEMAALEQGQCMDPECRIEVVALIRDDEVFMRDAAAVITAPNRALRGIA